MEKVIPVIYNDAKPFYNNLALAIKGAKIMCWEGGEYSEENPCEHWDWKGNIVLINTNNEIVLDDLSLVETSYLDWYSLKINQTKLDSIYISLKSKSGNTYSFIDIHKQFEKWFYQEFIPKNKTDQLENELFEILAFDKEKKWRTKKKEEKDADFGTWILDSKKEFFSGNKKKIYKILDKINHKSYETIISNDSSPILFDDKSYPTYFTDCGIYDTQKYPYFTVTITKNTTGKTVNSLGFIRTQGGGYKLLEID